MSFQWVASKQDDGSRVLKKQEISLETEVGDYEVLVKISGASLNYRDLMTLDGTYPWAIKDDVVLGCDGAGTVILVGRKVTRFAVGDKVITTLFASHISGPISPETPDNALGTSLDGTFRSFGSFSEEALVRMPIGLSFTEAATLSCAGVTAWNAVHGLPGREPKPGDWVLTQGTGGVSLFALRFAKAAGARVIATTSSNEKADLLRKLGADHIINYRDTPAWGSLARDLTGGKGLDLVIEVGGSTTLQESVKCIRLDGTMSVLGSVGGITEDTSQPRLLDVWLSLFTARGLWGGSREQMEEMCKAIEADVEGLRPVMDPRVFDLDGLGDALTYMRSGAYVGKVVLKVN